MKRDFTIIFEKMDEQTQQESSEQYGNVRASQGEIVAELDELAELRRLVAEITESEPLSFTTT
jgi:hypothetical protein